MLALKGLGCCESCSVVLRNWRDIMLDARCSMSPGPRLHMLPQGQ